MAQKNKTSNPITIINDKENPIPVGVLADAIVSISDGIKKLSNSPLSRRALLLLIADNCAPIGKKYHKKHVSISTIDTVLKSIESLKQVFTK